MVAPCCAHQNRNNCAPPLDLQPRWELHRLILGVSEVSPAVLGSALLFVAANSQLDLRVLGSSATWSFSTKLPLPSLTNAHRKDGQWSNLQPGHLNIRPRGHRWVWPGSVDVPENDVVPQLGKFTTGTLDDYPKDFGVLSFQTNIPWFQRLRPCGCQVRS